MQGIKQTIRPYTASLSYVTCSTGAASQAFSLITRMDSSYTSNVALVQPASRFCLETYIWCSLTKIQKTGVLSK
jgi:hypothetical protein